MKMPTIRQSSKGFDEQLRLIVICENPCIMQEMQILQITTQILQIVKCKNY